MTLEAQEPFKVPSFPTKEDLKSDEVATKAADNVASGSSLPYAAPSWACKPLEAEGACRLEVIKNGVVVDNIHLTKLAEDSTFLAFGRFKPCHVQLEHPSVSRFHCIMQYGQFMSQDPKWFLYDLGSTHGTKLNKRLLKKHAYVEIKPGYVFQLADSSRVFSFCGPVNELELEEEEAAMREARRPMRGPQVNPDAEDDEEEDAVDADGKRTVYYEKDPVGWLTKYFEREGIPLKFQYNKADTASEGLEGLQPKRRKGGDGGPQADWVCSIDLPDDSSINSPVTLIKASAFTRKLAQFHCALLACERLEGIGVLRTYSMWNKRTSYADNDYYDSDEDIYFDRTGQIEEQREKRMRREEALLTGRNGTKAQSHEELSKKLADSENKLNIVRSELMRMAGKNSCTDSESQASASNFSMRIALSQLRNKEKKFLAEAEELKRLVELSRPADLEKSFPSKVISSTAALPPSTQIAHTDKPNEDFAAPSPEQAQATTSHEVNPDLNREDEQGVSSSNSIDNQDDEVDKHVPVERRGAARRPLQPATTDYLTPKYGILTKEEARIKHPVKINKRRVISDELKDDYSDISAESREDYATWLPPAEQLGDGKTRLNEKFEGRY